MWMITQGGDLDMVFFCGIQNTGTRLATNDLSVDSKIYLFQMFCLLISYNLFSLASSR